MGVGQNGGKDRPMAHGKPAVLRPGNIDGRTRYADDATLEYIAKLEQLAYDRNQDYLDMMSERDEWKLRALTAESMEEDAQQAAARFNAERDKLRVLLLRADEALCMAIDIDDPNLTPSERDWIITQARGTHSDITAALQEAE